MSGADMDIRALLGIAPVIPVFTPHDVDAAVAAAQALVRGGLPVIEVTLRTATAMAAIKAIAEHVPGAIVGAGTVLDARQLEQVKASGGRFAVSPGSTPRLYAAAAAVALPFLPGVTTSSELMLGLEHGLDTFKFFPAAQAGGVAVLAAWGGVFGQVRFCPTGGISAQSASQYLALPNVLCVGGSWLTPREHLQAGDWTGIERLAREAAGLRGAPTPA